MAQGKRALESLELGVFAGIYRNRRVLLTGHTGFKGSWLALWLQSMDAEVTGLALAPDTEPSHWNLLNLDIHEHRADIRDRGAVSDIVKKSDPEIVFHLAAQSLVRQSYHEPVETWATNVMGTVNLVEACRQAPSLKAIVAVTTDKCYENRESLAGYKESDRLGGHDPYSASKAATEMAVASYRDSFFKDKILIATARAGNVIGGGDWAKDRIIPDLARASKAGEELIVRSPNAVRPWQHVLEPLAGYLQLGQKLLAADANFQGAWNFGPDDSGELTVSNLLNQLKKYWPETAWRAVPDSTLHETNMLKLDSAKARTQLGWKPVLPLERQLQITAEWYGAFLKDKKILSGEQLSAYCGEARKTGASWAA